MTSLTADQSLNETARVASFLQADSLEDTAQMANSGSKAAQDYNDEEMSQAAAEKKGHTWLACDKAARLGLQAAMANAPQTSCLSSTSSALCLHKDCHSISIKLHITALCCRSAPPVSGSLWERCCAGLEVFDSVLTCTPPCVCSHLALL